MHSNVPNLMLVRVLTPGGPYRAGDIVSVAFSEPTIGRLQSHAGAAASRERSSPDARVAATDIVPHAVSARVLTTSGPYGAGDAVTLSFVDPSLARIHAVGDGAPDEPDESQPTVDETPIFEEATVHALTVVHAPTVVLARSEPVAPEYAGPQDGVRVSTEWDVERARRFVHVVDKLFTIDRLGWYRHVFAMRLLLPDTIDCSDDAGTADASHRLDVVRTAATETLGRPLLAAFMPNFTVSAEWLETIDTPAIARALGDLRRAIVPFARDDRPLLPIAGESKRCLGSISSTDVSGDVVTCVDAFVATLIPSATANPSLALHLEAYRSTLADVFSQTAQSAEAVRLGRMCEPNHALDDRLWRLVGTVGTSFDALAVA